MKQAIAKHLLHIEAVFLRPNEPFTWASGILSPIYCDNRLTLSYPKVRNDVADGLGKLLKEHFPEAEMIAGTATAGIPHLCASRRPYGRADVLRQKQTESARQRKSNRRRH